MKLLRNIKALLCHISLKRRWQLLFLTAGMFIGAIAEMATLGAVMPFLALIANPDGVQSRFTWLSVAAGWIGADFNNLLLTSAVVFCMIAILAAIVRIIIVWANLRVSFALGEDIGYEVYRAALYQPYRWHVAHNSSEIIASLEKVNIVVYGVITPMLQGLAAITISLGIVFALLMINYEMAIISGGSFLALYILTSVFLKRHLIKNSRIISFNLTQRIKTMQEGIGCIRDILLDSTQGVYLQQFSAYDNALRRGQAINSLIGTSPRFIIEAVGMILIVVLAYWVAHDQPNGFVAAIPALGALAIGAQKLLPQMQQIYSSWSSFNSSREQLTDILKFLDEKIPEEKYKSTLEAKKIEHVASDESIPIIALKNVSFRYAPNEKNTISGITMQIQRGTSVGFIGKTGSGKSTLVDLVMGLLDVSEGSIEIDGIKLTHQNIKNWQKRIAHVPQSIYLTDASIAENIAFGVLPEEINLERVKEAAEMVQLTGFIEDQTEKYQTLVGERGVRLSGGQRQRIGLARALYKQADVLILDEATSALDSTTEGKVMEEIVRHGAGVTLLMIAHRVSTLNECDLIFEVENGTITRSDSYSGYFHSLS